MDQKLYTFTCNATASLVHTFLPKTYKQIPTQIYSLYLNIRQTDSLFMYYIHGIPKALTDTQPEFCAGNPQNGCVAARQYTNGGSTLQIHCRKQV